MKCEICIHSSLFETINGCHYLEESILRFLELKSSVNGISVEECAKQMLMKSVVKFSRDNFVFITETDMVIFHPKIFMFLTNFSKRFLSANVAKFNSNF